MNSEHERGTGCGCQPAYHFVVQGLIVSTAVYRSLKPGVRIQGRLFSV